MLKSEFWRRSGMSDRPSAAVVFFQNSEFSVQNFLRLAATALRG
jgi:hypothetical protein